jgi:hypothetical protein
MSETGSGDPVRLQRFDDDTIPVLTDRVPDAKTRFVEAKPVKFGEPAEAPPAHLPDSGTLRENVRQAVIAQLTAEYIAILRERLAPAIEASAAQLAAEAMESVLPTLSERIDAAIAARRIDASPVAASETRAPAVDLDHDDAEPVRSGD